MDKCFLKLSSGRVVWRSAERNRKPVQKALFYLDRSSSDKIENLRGRNKQHIVFKYAESYGSSWMGRERESGNQWNRKVEL